MSTAELAHFTADPSAIDDLDDAGSRRFVTQALVNSKSWLAVAAKGTDPAPIADFRAWAATVAEATRQRNLATGIRLDAEEMVRRAERGIGVAIRNGQKAGEIKRKGEHTGNQYQPGASVDNTASKPAPGDYVPTWLLSHSTSSGIYGMTDGVTDEQFEAALQRAKAHDGNLTRANVIRRIKKHKTEGTHDVSTATPITTDGDVVVHPAAALLPTMTDAEFDALVADIRANGLRQPIVRNPAGAILDGRARWRACQKLGFEARWVVHRGDPWTYVIQTNLHRRRLTHSHRAMIAAALADRTKGQSHNTPQADLPPTRGQAEKLLGVAPGSLDRAKRVIRSGTDALKTLTAEEGVALNTAARIARLPAQAQDAFVAQVRDGADPRQLGRPGGAFDQTPISASITAREARYRFVQEPVLRVLADSLDGLALVLASAEGLDPAITAAQAAHWNSDLGRRARSLRQLLSLLKERSK